MVSGLFKLEIGTLESQVAALQSQIAQVQQRIAVLGECELETDGAIQALTSAVQKVGALAPDAIATLKSAVVALFNSGDSDQGEDKGDGGQPLNPAPTPDPTEGEGINSDSMLNGDYCQIDPDAYWITAQPDGSRWELASPIACLLEDCPPESLLAQSVKIACLLEGTELNYSEPSNSSTGSLSSPDQSPAYIDLIKVTDSVSYMRRLDGEIISVYVGGNNKGKLKNWGDWITRSRSITHGFEIRVGKRLGTKWELKLTSMTLAQIERLATCDFSKDPRTNYPDAPKHPVEHVPSMREIEGISVGDTVRSTTVKNWQYKVTGIDSDNFLVCDLAEPDICSADRIGANPPISQVLHPGSVELVSKADVVDVAAQELEAYIEQQAQSIAPVIDPTDVPRGVILRQTSDDFIVEFNVFAWVIVRNQGVPEPQQKQIGRLVEGLGKIESYRPKAGIYHAFTQTRDAVNYLISGSGFLTSY